MKTKSRATSVSSSAKPLRNGKAYAEKPRVLLREQIPAYSSQIDSDDDLYRPLTSTSLNEMTPYQRERALAISSWLYERDPLAASMIDMPRKALKRGGISFEAEDKRVQELLEDWWRGCAQPMSALLMGDNAPGLFGEAMISGELSMPFFVHENGHVEYGFIDSRNIEAIEKSAGNALRFESLTLKADLKNPEAKRTFTIINKTLEGAWIGEVFHFMLFARVNAMRGRPLLLRFMDQLDLYSQFLFNEAERAAILRSFVWLVTLEGQQPEDCRKWLNENFPTGTVPKPGTVRAKNEAETWEALNPALNASENAQFAEFLKLNVVGPQGYPIFFYGGGGNVNNTVSREMMTRADYEFAEGQSWLNTFCQTVGGHFIQANQTSNRFTFNGYLDSNLDKRFRVKFGSPIPRDEVQASATLATITNAVSAAIQTKICDQATGIELFLVGAKALGIEKTREEVERAIAEDLRKTRPEEDSPYARLPFSAFSNGKANGKALNPDGERNDFGEADGESGEE